MSRRLLQVVLAAMGGVATVAGASGMVRGPAEIGHPEPVPPSIDSEYRFYAVWYHVAGLALLAGAGAPEDSTTTVRLFSAGLFAAGCARVVSRRRLGPPRDFQTVLTALELVVPLLVVPWQARVASAASR